MESELNRVKPTFTVLKVRLIRVVNRRIHNGEFTERGLARILQISQPHLHHLLKQSRKLHADLADKLMLRLGLSILDLLDNSEVSAEFNSRREGLVTFGQRKS